MNSPSEGSPSPKTVYPHVSEALMEHLEKRFPNECPKVNMTDREIWIAVGARRVVEHLRHCQEQTESSAQEHVTRV